MKGTQIMDGYGQHYESMYTGSMVGSGAVVFALMGYVIAKTNHRTSVVELNPVLLAAIIGEPVEKIQEGIDKLCAPDPNSRTPTEEGRRLIRQGAFSYFVVNFRHYRDILRKDRANILAAERMQRKRERDEQRNSSVTDRNMHGVASASVSGSGGDGVEGVPPAATLPTLEEVKGHAARCGLPDTEAIKCYHYYAAVGWMRGNTRLTNIASVVAKWCAQWRSDTQKPARPATRTGAGASGGKNWERDSLLKRRRQITESLDRARQENNTTEVEYLTGCLRKVEENLND